MLQLVVSSFSMRKVSNQVVCCEFMENPRIEDPDGDVVDSNVGTVEHEEAVVHDSKAYVRFRVTSICKFIFVEHDLTIV